MRVSILLLTALLMLGLDAGTGFARNERMPPPRLIGGPFGDGDDWIDMGGDPFGGGGGGGRGGEGWDWWNDRGFWGWGSGWWRYPDPVPPVGGGGGTGGGGGGTGGGNGSQDGSCDEYMNNLSCAEIECRVYEVETEAGVYVATDCLCQTVWEYLDDPSGPIYTRQCSVCVGSGLTRDLRCAGSCQGARCD